MRPALRAACDTIERYSPFRFTEIADLASADIRIIFRGHNATWWGYATYPQDGRQERIVFNTNRLFPQIGAQGTLEHELLHTLGIAHTDGWRVWARMHPSSALSFFSPDDRRALDDIVATMRAQAVTE